MDNRLSRFDDDLPKLPDKKPGADRFRRRFTDFFRRLALYGAFAVGAHLIFSILQSSVFAGFFDGGAQTRLEMEFAGIPDNLAVGITISKVCAGVFLAALLLLSLLRLYRDNDKKRELLAAADAPGFTVRGFWVSYTKGDLIAEAVYLAVVLIPFAVFFAIFGFEYLSTVLFEKIYRGFMFFFGVTKSALFGFILTVAVFCAALAGGSYVIFCSWYKRRIRGNALR